jgi:hypothetical protein
MESGDYKALVEQASAEMKRKNNSLIEKGLVGNGGSWFVDQPTGKITFTRPNGARVIGDVQIIGTYGEIHGTWLWAWNNTSILAPLRRDAWTVRQYGEQHTLIKLTTAEFECEEADCWNLTAIACHLNKAQGGYRGPHKLGLTFMTFDKLEVFQAG